jgi:hypothetical protein
VAPACIESLVSQTVLPAQVVLVVPTDSRVRDPFPVGEGRCAWHIVRHLDTGSAAAHNEALRVAGSDVLAVAFLDDEWMLAPEYVAVVDKAFRQCSDVGIVSPWHHEDGDICTDLPPAFPYQWVWNDIGPCAAFRMTAVEQVDAMRPPLADSYAMWDMCNAILAGGWRAAPFPAALASRVESTPSVLTPIGRPLVSYESILSRFSALLAADAVEVAVLLQVTRHRLHAQTASVAEMRPTTDRTMTPLEVLRATTEQRRDLVRRAIADPAYVARWLAWHGRRAAGSGLLHNLMAAARAVFSRRRS